MGDPAGLGRVLPPYSVHGQPSWQGRDASNIMAATPLLSLAVVFLQIVES